MADDEADREGGPPLSDLADHVRSRGPEGEGGPAGPDEAFRPERFEEIEGDSLWSALEADRPTVDAPEPTVRTGDEADEHVVSKRLYCEGCEHFADPPAVQCDHPGTTIVEFVDSDHVRLRNCPVVASRLALDDVDEDRLTQNSFGSR